MASTVNLGDSDCKPSSREVNASKTAREPYHHEATTTAAAIGSSIAAYMKSKHTPIQTGDDNNSNGSTTKKKRKHPSCSSASTGNAPIMLHPNDVLFGRGNDTARHSGNQRFRAFVDEKKLQYSSASSRREKSSIVDSIIQRIYSLDPPGRFLESVEEAGRKHVGGDGVTVALLRSLQCDVGVPGSGENHKWKIADVANVIKKTRKALTYLPTDSSSSKKNSERRKKDQSNVDHSSAKASQVEEFFFGNKHAASNLSDDIAGVPPNHVQYLGRNEVAVASDEINKRLQCQDQTNGLLHSLDHTHDELNPLLSPTNTYLCKRPKEAPNTQLGNDSTFTLSNTKNKTAKNFVAADVKIERAVMESVPNSALSPESEASGSSIGMRHGTVERERMAANEGSLTNDSLALMSITTNEMQQQGSNYSVVYESLTTRILHVPSLPHALKMLVQQFPSTEHVLLLKNEYRTSKHLSNCGSTRSALKLLLKKSFNAIYLEWVEGTTLKEWIKSAHMIEDASSKSHDKMNVHAGSDKSVDYESCARLALEISKALKEIHQFGVVHNNLTAENIIVDVNKDHGSFSVKIIGLGLSSILDNHDHCSDQRHEFQNDILMLGSVFYELFYGRHPSKYNPYNEYFSFYHTQNEEQQTARSSSCTLNHGIFPPKILKVPVCLSTFVLNLTKKRGTARFYNSMEKVVSDLQDLITNSREYLHNNTDDDINVGRLKFPSGKLYGRDDHLRVLMEAYMRVNQPTGKSEMVVVSGCSGAGKTVLVQKFRQSISTDTNFLLGKFDRFQQVVPQSAIISAFADFCEVLIARDNENSRKTKANIKEAVSSQSNVLERLIPSLREITDSRATMENIFHECGIEAQNALKYVFRLFVRAIASPEQPMVLCLDDLQWIDPTSLDLMTSLITDARNSSLLLICLYQENEVSDDGPLNTHLRYIERKVASSRIKVDNLNRKEVNELISGTLDMSNCSTESLADAIYRKTNGNALFVLQFIRYLYDEGLLNFSFRTKQWEWETELIISTNIYDGTVKLMSHKVMSLPKEAQSALKIVACLGSLTEELVNCLTAREVLDSKNVRSTECFNICQDIDNFLQWLDFSTKEGLINHTSSGYNFVHDQIQVAVYALIPDKEKGLWHLQIGTNIWMNKTIGTEDTIFVAVCQLNRGISFVTTKHQRNELAQLNLQAGKRAISLAAYPLAASFLETGRNLIDERCWEEMYDVSLQLYSSLAESCYCNGHFEEMSEALGAIFRCARSFNDKYLGYLTLIRALAAQSNSEEAIKVGLFVLEELGEHFPSPLEHETAATEFLKAKQQLEDKTASDVLGLRVADNDKKKAAMEVLRLLCLISSAYESSAAISPLFAFRLVQLSLRYGLCNESVVGFISYAYALRGTFNDIGGAYYWGKVSMRLLDIFKRTKHVAFVYCGLYGGLYSWIERHQASIEPLKYAYGVSMKSGDIQLASLCAIQFCIYTFQSGEKLEIVEVMMRIHCEEMLDDVQEMYRETLQVWRQTVLNLMGQSDDPLKFTVGRDEHFLIKHSICHNLSWLAYLFGNYELASKMAEKCQVMIDSSCSPSYTVGSHVFILGLISLALVRTTNQIHWISTADKTIKKMAGWAEHAPANFHHKLLLMQAEKAFLLGDSYNAAKKYEEAIKKAAENGFIQEQAIAYELAGSFYLSQADTPKASRFYRKAHAIYLQWGAQGKADHLRLNFPF